MRGSPGKATRVAFYPKFRLSSKPSSLSSSPLVHFATASRVACRSFFKGDSGGSSSRAGPLFQICAYSRPLRRVRTTAGPAALRLGRLVQQHDEFRDVRELPQGLDIISVLRGTTASRNCSRATRGLSQAMRLRRHRQTKSSSSAFSAESRPRRVEARRELPQ